MTTITWFRKVRLKTWANKTDFTLYTTLTHSSTQPQSSIIFSDCNMTLYHQWAQEDFQGISKDLVIPKTNLRWWDVENFEKNGPFVLRNSHAVKVLGTKCRQYMQAIKMGLSGRHGPVSDQAIFDVMCTEYCIVNDQFREEVSVESERSERASKAP